MTDNLQLAVNHALNDLQIARARMGLLNAGMGIDNKRPQAWCEYGFPQDLTFHDFYALYRRGGVAHGAVGKVIGLCWRTNPWIIEGDDQDGAKVETAWEATLKPLMARGKFWKAFAEADTRRLVGRFSGLLLQVRDGNNWDQPVTKGKALVKMIPAWAGALKPIIFDDKQTSETYGEPTMWQYTEASRDGRAGRQMKVHPDRVFILGDWTSEAIGFLEPAYNAFVSLEKVEGGSGESFLKNAARQIHMDFKETVDLNNIASMYGVTIDQLNQRFNEAARQLNRGNDVLLPTQGATATQLVSAVSDPGPTYNVNLQTAAAALDIPTKILVGMQTGERASSEDQKYFNARCQARRNELTFEINDLVAHLMRIGVIELKAEYTAMWDDLTTATQGERLADAKIMSEINQTAMATGETVFTADEIREQAGFDPLEGGEPLPDVEPPENEDGPVGDPSSQSE
ncbi:DUF1073 domain-containing protein [Pseudomonas citronellolis]|uniref:DUF1073 domain-containing protein n=1 Tax=Pseudomonas citronellolis TaxID=53408 RepID=A0A1A9KAK5_9PSED|nr:anti-CBASS Acb1 family protein [Pseudomonas citronellolis]ANI14471.1 DUF1073 domain-containing protein [Pseudomonas citronellolis]